MVLDQLFVYALVLFLLPSDAYSEADTYEIPITFNPLIQKSVEKSSTIEIFYDLDKPFYSKVTVIDAAKNTERHVKNVITKTISVIFLTTASSHVSGSLELSDLRYTEPSKWSYTLKVQSILNASNGTISKFTDAVVLYKIQESAMKVLEKRYGFSVGDILVELGLTKMEFYGVDEKQWIDVVGIITEKVITNKTEKLNLTSCYLAEMVNKTEAEIKAFTLNEVDMYLYNTSLLMDKLPGYRNTVISSLYQTFNITAPQLASISNISISIINKMQLKDVIQVFTTSILNELHVSKAEIIQSDPIFQPEMLLSCKDKWEPFKRLAISKSFDNAAKDMSITSQTLASLLEISYTDVNMFTMNEMINILAIIIQPLKEDKIMVESPKLHDVVASHSSETLNSTNDNAFAAIQLFTHFTTRQLTLLYGWKEQDYQFAKMFSLDDINKACFLDPNDYSLFILATINVGEAHYSCKSFNVLREIWQRKSIEELETTFSNVLPFDEPISSAITLLTKAPLAISYRPLNITTEEQEIVQKITFNNISTVTTYSDSTLKKMSFQEVIELAVHLYQNGSFHLTVKVTTHVQGTISSSIRSTTSIIPTPTSTMATTTTTKHNSISQVSSTIKTTISKTPSDTPPHIFTTVTALYKKSTSTYLPNSTVSTSRMSSLQIHQSPKSKIMNATASIKPSTTKHETMTSSVTKPAVDICQSMTTCKDDQACIPDSGHYKCEAAQNLQASFKITKGLTFSQDLSNKNSDVFLNLSRQMEYLIDSVYKKTIYSSNYFGSKVTEFKKGSVIVLYKLLFKNNWSILSSIMQNITNAFKDEVGNMVGSNFVITNISSVQDFDECSSDKTNDCYKTANCNNTIGSYNCFCPSGTLDDGKTCKANSSPRDNDDDVPWIIYVVIAIMVALIIFLIVVLIYCEKKHKKRNRPHLDLYNNGINMYPRSTSYLAETPESEADLADGLGIVNRRGPQPNMVTFNPSPEEKKELETQNGQPGMLLSFKRIDPD